MPRSSLFWKVLSKEERRAIVYYEGSANHSDPYLPDDVMCCGVCGEPMGVNSCDCDKHYSKLINKANRLVKRIIERNRKIVECYDENKNHLKVREREKYLRVHTLSE